MKPHIIRSIQLGCVLCCSLFWFGVTTANAQISFPSRTVYKYPLDQRPDTLATGDLNGDGFSDVVVGTAAGVAVFLNQQNGTLGAATTYPTKAAKLVIADLNGDGKPDLVSVTGDGRGFHTWLNKGDGTFQVVFNPGNDGTFDVNVSLAVGDFYGDGRSHLAINSYYVFGGGGGYPTLKLYRNSGNGTFTNGPSQPLTAKAGEITAADINGDSLPDLLVANSNNGFTTFLNTGNGNLGGLKDYNVETYSFAVGDFDGDGDNDLIIGVPGGVALMLNTGVGLFGDPVYYSVGIPIGYPIAVDIDGDGYPDLLIPGNNSDVVLRSKGDGTFDAPVTLPNTINIRSKLRVVPAVFDINKDGKIDVVVANDSTQEPSISILLNQTPQLPSNQLKLTRITPQRGGNAGRVTVSLVGRNFTVGTRVKLKCPIAPDIISVVAGVDLTGRTLAATFDLRGSAPATCDLVVTNPDGMNVTIQKGFTIEQGGESKLSAEVIGISRLRVGRTTPLYVIVKNEGLIDADYVVVDIETETQQTAQTRIRPKTGGLSQSQLTLQTAPNFNGLFSLGALSIQGLAISFTPLTQECKRVKVKLTAINPTDECNFLILGMNAARGRLPFLYALRVANTASLLQDVIAGRCFYPGRPGLNELVCDAKLILDKAYSEAIQGVERGHELFCINYKLKNCPGNCDLPDNGLSVLGIFLDIIKSQLDRLKQLKVLVATRDVQTEYDMIINTLLPKLQSLPSTINDIPFLPFLNQAIPPPTSVTEFSYCVRTSWDPNEKDGLAGSGTSRYVKAGSLLSYSISFENLATATAPAAEVVITDQLDPNLDWSTFSINTIRIGNKTVQVPIGLQNFIDTIDLRPEKNFLVKIVSQLNPASGLVTVRFSTLDPSTGQPPVDQLAGFLPPNRMPPEGEGSISYTVMTKQGLATGSQIKNLANIVFDANAAIITPEWLNTIDSINPTSRVTALNSIQTVPNFTVKWAGTDEGAGIQDYTVFVSEDGKPFTTWLANAVATEAVFSGQAGKRYAFYSAARDLVGNVESAKTAAETATLVCSAITLNQSLLPSGMVGAAYSQTLAAAGGVTPYTFAVSGGQLPAGLTLAAGGALTGTPTQFGTFNFTVMATDANGCGGSQSYALVIACPTITLGQASLASGVSGTAYSQTLTATDGTAPYIFTMTQGALPVGLMLSTAGVLSGTPAAAGSFNLTVTVTDANGCTGQGSYTLVVNASPANTPPTISIADPFGCTGPGDALTVTLTLTNSAAVAQTVAATASLPAGLLGLSGTGIANTGIVTVNPTTVSFNATLAAGATATVIYQVQVGDLIITGTTLCINTTASFGGGLPIAVQACATINCPSVGPGTIHPAASEVSDQKAGSVLVYNLYSSSATSNTQDTRISITNTNPNLEIAIHFFFVDGSSCSVADAYLCLTPNQTTSFLVSDLDPGSTGYIVAVASDMVTGCPVNFNFLIGDEYIKLATGHTASLGAEAFAALAGGLPACDASSVLAQLNFDGISYNRAPQVLAIDNIPSRADNNDTLLVVNRFGGNLGIGADTLGTLFGIFYDDAETALSFSLTSSSCQLRTSITNTTPRLTPRFETFISAGRTGWAKLYSLDQVGLLGAVLNRNSNVAASPGAFNGGHNLHKLRLTSSVSLIIPIFPPSC